MRNKKTPSKQTPRRHVEDGGQSTTRPAIKRPTKKPPQGSTKPSYK